MNKIKPWSKWIKVDAIKIKVSSVSEHGIYLRIYFDFNGQEKDMFPDDGDFFLGNGGTLTLGSTKVFKMKVKVSII